MQFEANSFRINALFLREIKMKQIRKFFLLVKPYRKRQIGYIIFNVFASVFSTLSILTLLPFLEVIFSDPATLEGLKAQEINLDPNQLSSSSLKELLSQKIQYAIGSVGHLKALYIFSGLIIIMFLLKNVFNYLSFYAIAFIRSAVVRDLRKRSYEKSVDLPLAYFSEERKGDLISRMTNDVKEVEWGVVGAIEMLLKHPFYILTYLFSLFLINWQLTLFVLFVLPISGYIISRVGKSLKGTATAGQAKLGELIEIIEETLGGLKIIKAFTSEGKMKSNFDAKNQDHFNLMVKLHRRELAASPLSEFMGSIIIALLMVFAGRLVLEGNGELTGPYFLAFIGIFSQLITPAKALSQSYFRVKKAEASFNRVEEILLAEDTVAEQQNAIGIDSLQEGVSYKNVHFKYTDAPILEDVSFEMQKGQVIALVGSSGGGKSTIADLLPRFYDIQKGSIEVDGLDIKKAKLKDLRSLFGVVSQESILFNDTVAFNIKLGTPNATEEEIMEAAKIANAHDFILSLDKGYQTVIGDRGNKLSGGQKQRLAIARAVLRNPNILILDEATSALDTESEKLVQDALVKLMANRTSLVIAHRLSTIKNADMILVLDKGQIIERGTHSELYAFNGFYKKLCDLQSF
jgi:ATP-binding cassette, subfamily B, bacterial MsbA